MDWFWRGLGLFLMLSAATHLGCWVVADNQERAMLGSRTQMVMATVTEARSKPSSDPGMKHFEVDFEFPVQSGIHEHTLDYEGTTLGRYARGARIVAYYTPGNPDDVWLYGEPVGRDTPRAIAVDSVIMGIGLWLLMLSLAGGRASARPAKAGSG